MKKKIIYLAMILVSGTALLNACSKSSGSTSSSQTKPVTKPVVVNAVNIQNFAFSPASISIKVGDTVSWTNTDAAAHTVSDKGGSFDSGNLASGNTFKFNFTKAGTYTYYCKYHSMMLPATVVVK